MNQNFNFSPGTFDFGMPKKDEKIASDANNLFTFKAESFDFGMPTEPKKDANPITLSAIGNTDSVPSQSVFKFGVQPGFSLKKDGEQVSSKDEPWLAPTISPFTFAVSNQTSLTPADFSFDPKKSSQTSSTGVFVFSAEEPKKDVQPPETKAEANSTPFKFQYDLPTPPAPSQPSSYTFSFNTQQGAPRGKPRGGKSSYRLNQ